MTIEKNEPIEQQSEKKAVLKMHIELNKGGKRTFANFQAKTQHFRSRF